MYEALGWSDVRGGGTCNEVPDGEQRCFRNTAVTGPDGIDYGSEEPFARRQGCVPSGEDCHTSPAQNPGKIWCCPPGWPRTAEDGLALPGQYPPAPPGLMNKFNFYSQYWWFWAIMLAVPVVGYLGYKTFNREKFMGAADLSLLEIEAIDEL
jgi:hypothetical protein